MIVTILASESSMERNQWKNLVGIGLWLMLWGASIWPAQAQYQPVGIALADPVDEAEIRRALLQAYPLLLKEGVGLVRSHYIESPGGHHYAFTQTYQGWPVFRAGVKVNIDRRPRISSFLSTLVEVEKAAPAAFSYSAATLRLRLGELAAAHTVHIERQWWAESGQLRPVWRALTYSDGPMLAYEWLFDARTGEELLRTDRAMYHHAPHARPDSTSRDTFAWGRIFLPNPCTKAQVPYGALFIDSMDIHKPIFTQLMDTVLLRNVSFRQDSFRLEGPYVIIQDRSARKIAPVVRADDQFYYQRDSSGFEDVMVYYFIDTFQRYVQSLGFFNLYNSPISADPHGFIYDNSAFTINNGDPYLKFGEGNVDDAEDGDIILHEYTHALSYAASGETNLGVQRKGIDEGYANYFAAGFTYDLGYPNWYEVANWDGHNEFWSGYWAISNKQYPDYQNSQNIYELGEIWASTLMQIRQAIGDTITDRLVLQTLYSSFIDMKMPTAASLLIKSDSMLYGGVHTPVLNDFFCQREIFDRQNPACVVVHTHRPAPPSGLRIFPQPNQGHFTLEWIQETNQPARWQVLNLLGQVLEQGELSGPGRHQLRLSLPTGAYVFQLLPSGQLPYSHPLLIQP